MDAQAIRERLEKLTYRQLQQEAKKNGVKAKGTKEKLLKNVLKKLALEPFDSSFSSSAADTTGQTLDTTTQSRYSKVDEEPLNEFSADIAMNKNGSPENEKVNSTAIVAADTAIQVLDKADEETTMASSTTTTSAAMNESVSPKNEEVDATLSGVADTTIQVLDKADEETTMASSTATTSAAMNENVLPQNEEVDATLNGVANTTIQVLDNKAVEETTMASSTTITFAALNESISPENEEADANLSGVADTTFQVLDNANEETMALSTATTSAAMHESVSPENEEVDATLSGVSDTTYQVLDKADVQTTMASSTETTSAAMNENVSPKKGIFGGSPLKSPGVARQRFIDLHQRAAEQMTDIETDQKRKEERHGALTRCWTPNINKLSKPKFVTPSKKVPESPYKRRRSTTIETGTPSKKRYCQGLTYPELTPRLETLAQPKTPPRPVSRNRAQSVARMNYTPRKGPYRFVDTTGMSDEKFNEYKKQSAESRQY
jgi:hypothetical protein